MSFLVHLTPAEALPRLEERAPPSRKRDRACAAPAVAAASAHVLRINLVESEYLIAMLKAELAWVRNLISKSRPAHLVLGSQERPERSAHIRDGRRALRGVIDANRIRPRQLQVCNPRSPTRYRGAIWTLLILAPSSAKSSAAPRASAFSSCLFPKSWSGAAVRFSAANSFAAGAPAQPACLLLGLALSIAEEFIIQQTSIAPLPFPGANATLRSLPRRQLDLPALHAGIRKRLGSPDSCSGHRTHLSRTPRAAMAPQARPHRDLHRIPHRLPHRLVRLDAASAPEASRRALPPACDPYPASASPPSRPSSA